MRFLIALVAFGLGSLAGWYTRGWWYANGLPKRREILDHDEYLRRREALVRAYAESMREYDRLVTWISGGALLLSVTFLEKLSPRPRPDTAWLLSAAWALLATALLLSLISQYASTRLHSWRLSELDHLQLPQKSRTETWDSTAGRLDRGARVWGKTTKWSTLLSGVALFVGLMILSRFAFANVSFAQ